MSRGDSLVNHQRVDVAVRSKRAADLESECHSPRISFVTKAECLPGDVSSAVSTMSGEGQGARCSIRTKGDRLLDMPFPIVSRRQVPPGLSCPSGRSRT